MPTDKDGNGAKKGLTAAQKAAAARATAQAKASKPVVKSGQASAAAVAATAARNKAIADMWAKGGQTGQWAVGQGNANAAANAAIGTGYQDPFNGVDPLSALLAGINGSGAAGGGGGSGGGSSADAAAKAHALEMNLWRQIDALNQQEQQGLGAINDSYGKQGAAIDQLGAANTAGFDQYGNQLGAAQAGSQERLRQLLGELQGSAAATRGTSAGIFQGGDQALQGIGQQYAAMAKERAAGANSTLNAFGAGNIQASNGAQDYVTAARTNNAQQATAADQLYGTRSNAYNGLNSDASTQNDAKFNSLMANLAAQRQSSSAQTAQQKAQLAIQQQQAAQQLQLQTSAQRAALNGQLTGA